MNQIFFEDLSSTEALYVFVISEIADGVSSTDPISTRQRSSVLRTIVMEN